MDDRESREALTASLTAARKLFDAGDCAGAVEEVDAALAILLGPATRPAAPTLANSPDAPADRSNAASTASGPLISTGGYALFEQRVRRRRLDHCVAAARAAISSGMIREAADALDEAIELDPNLPERAALTAALNNLRRPAPHRHPRAWLVAAATISLVALSALWLEKSRALPSQTTRAVHEDVPAVRMASPQAMLQALRPQPPAPLATGPAQTLNPANLARPMPVANIPTPFNPASRDELQVKRALQRYRVAYEALDAQSAQAVWPAVNQVELARAFDALESQRLTFDACSVQMDGVRASATCRGTARYVPKVGRSEPRVEARVWSFALRKIGAEWKIDNARADR